MQRVLRRQGYPVPLNGSFDAATRRYAADYLTSISGEPTPENLSVREFYLRFEGGEVGCALLDRGARHLQGRLI